MKEKSDAVAATGADATKKRPVIADVVASFASAEPLVKKVKLESAPDASRSNDSAVESHGQRSRRTAAVVAQLCTTDFLQPTRAYRKRLQVDTEEEFQMAWICGECNEAECQIRDDADQLLVCEGVCRRLFHYPCAGLLNPPAEHETYVCQDCQRARHVCAFCQSYGIDEQDVFPCTAAKCGLFFHKNCLEMANIPIKLLHTPNSSEKRREFNCPSHTCGTCWQEDMIAKEKQLDAEARKSTKGRKKTKPSASSFGKKQGLTMVS